MKEKVIRERLEKSINNLAKVSNLLAKLEKVIGKDLAEQLDKITDIPTYPERHKKFESLVSIRDYDLYDKAEQYLSNLYKKQDLQALILKYENMLKIKEEESKTPEIKIIRNFLNKWKEETRDWYINKKIRFNQERDQLDKGDMYSYSQLIRRWEKLVGRTMLSEIINHSSKSFEERVTKLVEKEANRKYINLVNNVIDITGNITNTSHLHIDPKGEINGVIEGEKGVASINTFSAGGYNIQCFHYRTQIRKIK